jgi:hypothetical protein
MELHDLLEDVDFLARPPARRTAGRSLQALTRLAHVFAQTPEVVLQELVDLAVECCGADSAGISLETQNEAGERVFRWVAISGSFGQYLNGTTPRFFSPCGTCLDSGRAQHYRVTKPYYDFLGVTADEISDGMLIPWVNENLRGTIWAVAHHSREAFDPEDYRLLLSLADFASIAIRHQHQQEMIRRQEREVASAARAHELAHRINNPLQSLTNTIYLAQTSGMECCKFLEQAGEELTALSSLVKELLRRPTP